MNCVILKTALYTVILCLMRSCNSRSACTISKLCFTFIHNVLLPTMLCGYDLHIATPHCVQLVLNIANHNGLDNSSEPRNRESIKWDCTIILLYIKFYLISSRALSGRTIVRCSLLAHPPYALPSFLLLGLPPGLWSYYYFEGCLWAPIAFSKAWTSSDAL